MSSSDLQKLQLEETLSLKAAAALAKTLRDSSEHALEVSAQNVSHIDMHCAQILLSAKQKWAALNLPFEITPCSPQFKENLSILGMDDLLLSESGMD